MQLVGCVMKSFVNNRLAKAVIMVCLFTIVVSVVPAQALAFNVYATNQYPHKMWLAFIEWDDSAATWRCHGWQNVEPYSSKSIAFNNSTEGRYVYIYAYTSEASFGGDGYASSIPRVVNGDKFSYYDGETCPNGKNRRQVYFVQYEIVEGRVDFTP